ncbi:MAG TPA: hypothetical protein PK073_04790 [Ignavibacteriaceae bacterium]|jgi:hypothetical protein|nr:MAG: hypothetical protein BWY38_01142 [Ignavibacteria bacterium ADurb.Bin266]OQY74822.1 MAG: hypothetical protein B6D44_03355 [Ignavibacteriales bacterium UTCHB2]HQF42211.1 hypothetical protein [Ignavibacteriaceae bacterium]
MKIFQLLLLTVVVFNFISFPQVDTKIAVIIGNNYKLIDAENHLGIIYLSLNDLLENLDIPFELSEHKNSISVSFSDQSFVLTIQNPFVNILDSKSKTKKIYQLLNSPYLKKNNVYISSLSAIELINFIWNKQLIQLAPNRIKVEEKEFEQQIDTIPQLKISKLEVEFENDAVKLKLLFSDEIKNYYSFYRSRNLHLILWNVIVPKDSVIDFIGKDLLDKIEIKSIGQFTELTIHLKEEETISESFKSENRKELIIRISERDFGDWYTKESEHFKIIYRDSHSHLVNHLLASAENSLKHLMEIFNYKPEQKIIINTYDVSDYGFGGTTTIPENYIRIEIEPLEAGYEVIPYSERFQWLLSHELVHIVVNDMAGNLESSLRSIFGKVLPERNQPLSVLYSLLTNHNRYTPRWYQEAIAVFIETWFSGGYGRLLGSFDEMYFRSLVNEKLPFPSDVELENYTSHISIFLENILYLYGTRFVGHLADKYGVEKLINWFSLEEDEFYPSLEAKFEKVYNTDFDDEWNNFIKDETEFQKQNISTLQTAPLTQTKRLSEESFGWITKPYFDSKDRSLIFGFHKPGNLAQITKFDLKTNSYEQIVSLPSPSIIQIASLAYDETYNQMFYTRNNNQLFRDLLMYDFNSKNEKLIFEDIRVGSLTISPEKHELWGVQHQSGKAVLVRSKYPYTEAQSLSAFMVGDELQDLSINRKGDLLAVTLHFSNGQQSIGIADIKEIDKGNPIVFKTVSSNGTPENPSWSLDGNYLYWNAYVNGVANIYRYDVATEEITPLTNTIQGLFRPIEISNDSLLAFEFTTKGFIPVVFKIQKTERLPAIQYFGQRILDKSPELLKWNLEPTRIIKDTINVSEEKSYNSVSSVSLKTFIPTISGFQSRIVLGLYLQFNDPLLFNDLIIDAGISPFKETTNDIKYHLRLKYSYHQKFIVAAEYNATDFYDLFNKRKRGMLGGRFALGYNYFLIYDNPLKIKHSTELSLYKDIKYINDNQTEVSIPDYLILKSEIDIKDLRRTIGSTDWESGDWIRLSILGYTSDPKKPKYSGQLMAEWDKFFLLFFDHNVLQFKIATGYLFEKEEIPETKFYFGGFGNRAIENEPVKQYTKMFRFPGVPIYSIVADKFVKVMISNSLPALRIPGASFLGIDLKNINFSIFSQGLYSDSPLVEKAIDAGAQLNFVFQHWENLETTLSAGIAKAWWNGGNDHEWFISFKLLKD